MGKNHKEIPPPGKPGPKPKTDEEILSAIKRNKGSFVLAAAELGLTVRSIQKRLKDMRDQEKPE